MGIKHKKLKSWVDAGLLSESQASAIQSYEDSRKSGRFGRGLVGLSVFAILVGVLSIIASNWHAIPGGLKIGTHVLLNMGIGYAAYQSWKAGKNIWREGYSLAFFGLTLTLIALIGQVYQLDGEAAHALVLWMAITLPFMLVFAGSYMTVVPWMLAFLTTLGFAVGYYAEDWSDYWQGVVLTSLYILLPLTLMAKGSFAFFKNWKPVWADVCLGTGIVLTLLAATLSSIFMGVDRWSEYQNTDKELLAALDVQRLICFAGFAGIFAHAASHKFYRTDDHMKLGGIFAAVSLVIMCLPLFILQFHSDIGAAILFIAYWVFIGWIGQQLGQARIISLAIVLIAIRIFVVYLEVFGSLMETGFGLIIGGGVMLGLLWGARKLNKRLTGKAADL